MSSASASQTAAPTRRRPQRRPTAPDVVVLPSKLVPPRRAGPGVARPRLMQELDRLAGLPLTIVSAPPGYGKTTLLLQWIAGRPAGTTAWLSLDADDDDPRWLWAHVCAALGVDGPLPEDPEGTPTASAVLLAEAVGRTAGAGERVLVLDDYHHVTNPACHDRIRFLVEHLPAPLHLVIASRRDPPLPLSRMRAGGALGELRARDLLLDPEESRQLVEGHGVHLTPDDVQRLHEKTEGWPAGLYLAVLSLRGREDAHAFVEAFAGSHRHVVDYLASEVLAGEDEATTAFLLRSSVLDRMSGPVCDAVLGTSGSATTLRALERRNDLVRALDDDLTWFRYHPLLQDVLRSMLAEVLPDEVAALHMRASAWWEGAGDAERAVDHSLAAHDAPRAARLVGAHWREVAGTRGAAPVLDRWLARLPQATALADPGLCLVRAVLEEARGAGREVVDRWLDAADRGAAGTPATSALPFGTGSVALESALIRAASDGQDVTR
ncbi:MAG TPA: hypothetical protein VL422_06170, partial [Miltoncostaea sp.]|nr:hypothetical protein [Miltoncostaea sp.]